MPINRALPAIVAAAAVLTVLAPAAQAASSAPASAPATASARAGACDPALVAPQGSLIGNLWRSNGGPGSVYGCPITKEYGYADKRGSWQRFQNGKIVWSPNLGDGALIRVYRAANRRVIFRWSGTGRDWDFFNVREVYEPHLGNKERQVQVGRLTPWSGLHRWDLDSYARSFAEEILEDSVSHGSDDDRVHFRVQGCDRGTFSSDCGPWSIPIAMIL
jgi:hypothetical protein